MANPRQQRMTARSRAEEEFLAAQKKNKKTIEEKDRLRLEKAQHVADLKAKRLARDAAEPAGTAEIDAAKKPARRKSARNLPQFHRF